MPHTPLYPPNWQLTETFKERLGSSPGRQRIMEEGDELLIIVHEVPKPDEDSRRGILLWFDSRGEWRASNGDPGKVALENLIRRYSKVLDEYDALEAKADVADTYLRILDGLAPIKRATRNLLETLEQARKAVPREKMLIESRDGAYELSRRAELLYDDTKNSMDVAVIRRAEQQAASSHEMAIAAHRLNMLAALFFPIATLGAIFGTTLTDEWSWRNSAGPFMLFILAGVVSGVALAMYLNGFNKTKRL